MKKLVLSTILGFMVLAANAQSFQKNDVILLGGIGRSILSVSGWSTYQTNIGFTAKYQPPITLKGEYAISDEIGIGLSTAYSSATASWSDSNYSYRSSFNKLSITPRLNIHFLRKKVVDMYIGGGIGYKTGGYQFKTTNTNFLPSTDIGVIPISLEAVLGIRTFISPEFGAFAELGVGHGFFQFGFAYKPLVSKRN